MGAWRVASLWLVAGVAWSQEVPNANVWSLPSFDVAFPTGFRVMIVPDHDASVVGLAMAIDVGSASEKPGQHGLAHLIEHLWFRSHADGRAPTWDLLASLGCELNAATDFDTTTFQTACPAAVLPWVLQLEGRRLSDPLAGVTPEDFEREKGVVMAERALGSASREVTDAVLAAVHGDDHPYGHQPSGRGADLSAVTLDEARAFVAAHYTPANASLVVSGDVDPKALSRLLFRWFTPTTFHPALVAKPLREYPVPGVLAAPGVTTWFWPDEPDRPGVALQGVEPVARMVGAYVPSPWTGTTAVVPADVDEAQLALVWTLPPSDPAVHGFTPAMLAHEAEDLLLSAGKLLGITAVDCSAMSLRRETLLSCGVLAGSDEPSRSVVDRLAAAPGIDRGDSQFRLWLGPLVLEQLQTLEGVADPVGGRLEVLLHHAHVGYGQGFAATWGAIRQGLDYPSARRFLRDEASAERVHLVRLVPTEREDGPGRGTEAGADVGLSGADVALSTELPAGLRDLDPTFPAERVASRTLPSGLQIVAIDLGGYPMVDVAMYAPMTSDRAPAGVQQLAEEVAAWSPEPTPRQVLVLQPASGLLGDGAVRRMRADAGSLDWSVQALRRQLDTLQVRGEDSVVQVRHAMRVRRRAKASVGALAARLTASSLPSWSAGLHELSDAQLEGLAEVSRADMQAFLGATWRPEGAVLVLAGKLDPRSAVMVASDAFASWRGNARPLAPRPSAASALEPLLVGVHVPDGDLATVVTTCVAQVGGGDAGLGVELLRTLLERAQMRALRAESGLSYTPEVWTERAGATARYTLRVTVPAAQVGTALSFQRRLLDTVGAQGFLAEDVEDARRRYVLGTPLRRQTLYGARTDLAQALLGGASVDDWRAVTPLVAGLDAARLKALMAGCDRERAAQVWGDLAVVAEPARAAFPGRYQEVRPVEDAKAR